MEVEFHTVHVNLAEELLQMLKQEWHSIHKHLSQTLLVLCGNDVSLASVLRVDISVAYFVSFILGVDIFELCQGFPLPMSAVKQNFHCVKLMILTVSINFILLLFEM